MFFYVWGHLISRAKSEWVKAVLYLLLGSSLILIIQFIDVMSTYIALPFMLMGVCWIYWKMMRF
jgi:hypothetical protein